MCAVGWQACLGRRLSVLATTLLRQCKPARFANIDSPHQPVHTAGWVISGLVVTAPDTTQHECSHVSDISYAGLEESGRVHPSPKLWLVMAGDGW